MNSWIKNIIKEELAAYNGKQLVTQLKKDIKYLQDLKVIAVDTDPENMLFSFSTSKNHNDIVVIIRKVDVGWSCELEYNNSLKHATGGEFTWGPFTSYKELVYELNQKLHQNPLLDPKNLSNDYYGALNSEVIKLSKILLSMGDELKAVPKGDLEDLKDVYRTLTILDNDCDDDDLVKALKDRYEWKYNGLINTLNKIPQINYYRKLQAYKTK